MSLGPVDDSAAAAVRIVARAWREWRDALPSDLGEDCLVEAELALLRVSGRCSALSETERLRYAATCVRRAVHIFLARELAFRRNVVLVSVSLRESDGRTPARELAADARLPACDSLLDSVGREDLLAALQKLSPSERQLLDLFFVQELDDEEVGRSLGISAAAARKRKSRVIAKLRGVLLPSTSPLAGGGDRIGGHEPRRRGA